MCSLRVTLAGVTFLVSVAQFYPRSSIENVHIEAGQFDGCTKTLNVVCYLHDLLDRGYCEKRGNELDKKK